MILDAIACGLVVIFEFFAIIIGALLLNGLIYQFTGFSPYREFSKLIMKEVNRR